MKGDKWKRLPLELAVVRSGSHENQQSKNVGTITRIVLHWVDPWTGKFLAGFDAPLTKEKLATSFYSRQIQAFKPIAQSWCGVRKPKLNITYINEKAKGGGR